MSEMFALLAEDRRVLRISGADHRKFLQDLVTNDINGVEGGLVYAALLTPQGKYLADFFLAADGDGLLIDADAAQAPQLFQRLAMYKLRAAVELVEAPHKVVLFWGAGDPPDGAAADPRDPTLGWRLLSPAPDLGAYAEGDAAQYAALRIAATVPASGQELIPNESYILEAGFDRLNGVDFRKGCYVGQEVTARMRHKTELRKGFVRVEIDGTAPPPGTPIEAEGRPAGTLYSAAEGVGIAHLRFDRAAGPMSAGGVPVRWPDAPG
ncbi:MAG: folate-binding protein [Pseudomonadota bacterium]